MKFAQRISDFKFKWGASEGTAIINENQVEIILRPPITTTKINGATNFIFTTDFEELIVSYTLCKTIKRKILLLYVFTESIPSSWIMHPFHENTCHPLLPTYGMHILPPLIRSSNLDLFTSFYLLNIKALSKSAVETLSTKTSIRISDKTVA
ncbi:hypothetical protein CDAR_516431 [Caerostris darwini]|uniref:Uncharacterized protein n=1 Tax=Caerostris darwini TaxID=1538125 RepID=A0AAV4WZ59_9ARAC|nr:hypothetical protein CDAR_516431 [Caerostris darwini]